MLTDRVLSFRLQVETLAWVSLASLFVLVQFLPVPASQQTALSALCLTIGAYLLVTFRFLLPRSNYDPRMIYATLVADVLFLSALDWLLTDYLPHFEIAFALLIIVAALITDWRGTLGLALFAAVCDSLAALPPVLNARTPTIIVILNQAVTFAGFVLSGVVALFLMEIIRRQAADSVVADRRAVALEQQRRAEAERTARRWQVINAVGLKVQQEYQPRRIFETIATELKPLGIDCLIALWEEPGKTMRLSYLSIAPNLQGVLEQLTGQTVRDFVLNVNALPSVPQVLAEKRAVYLEGTHEIIRGALPHLPENLVQRVFGLVGASHLIVAPLLAGDQVVGLFNVWGHDLQVADLPAITGLAQQIAIAIDKARLFQGEQKRALQLSLVNEIAERVASLMDVQALSNEVTLLVTQWFGFEYAAVLVNDTRARQVILRAHAGRAAKPESIGYHQSWEVGLIGLAARTGETVVVNDVQVYKTYHAVEPALDVCRAELCVPLKRGDEVIGVLDVEAVEPNAFEPSDVNAMETLASQIAVAIAKSESFAAERKRAAQLSTVSAIAERAATIHDPDRLLSQVVELAHTGFGYHNVAVLTLDEHRDELVLRAIAGSYTKYFPPHYRQKTTVGLMGAAVREGTTVVVNDVNTDPRFYFPAAYPPVAHSEMCVPLKVGHRTLGVFWVAGLPVNAFDENDVASLETLANQIAIALENARLYAQTKDDAEVKDALLRELSHRVKNNLTVIAGLLNLGLDDQERSRDEVLNEALARVQSMATAHTLLAHSTSAQVDLMELGKRVITNSVRQLSLPGQTMPFTVHGESIAISARQATSLTLILNELVTNALAHGGDGSSRSLNLTIRPVEGKARVELFNQGRVSPEDFEPPRADGGVGLQLIRTLVEKDLHGTFTLDPRKNGIAGIILFPPERG